jgi:parvulin-like peptidyl-prolyl isomerase
MRSLRILFPLAVIAAALAAAGCGGSSSSQSVPQNSVAVVGSDQITRTTVSDLFARAKRNYQAQKRVFPKAGSAEYQALQSQIVQYLVQVSEFDQQAKDLKIEITPQQVDARLKQIKQQAFGGSEQKYQQQLKAQGLTDAEVREDLHAQMTSQALFNKITSSVKVSDSDIQAYYNAHKSQYVQPPSRDVRHILVKSKPLAQKLYTELRHNGGKNFAALAKKYSQDPGSKDNGGKLTISKGQTVPAFDLAAFTLPTNAISTPIHTQYGYHIIQPLSDVRPQKTTPLSSVKSSISSQLLQQKKNTAMTDWVKKTTTSYCSGNKLRYAAGYTPNPDPCAKPAKTTTT